MKKGWFIIVRVCLLCSRSSFYVYRDERAQSLQAKVARFVLRREKSVLKVGHAISSGIRCPDDAERVQTQLPSKTDKVVFCEMTELQVSLWTS